LQHRRRGRVVEGTPLLREHTGQNLYPGFESLRLRHFQHVGTARKGWLQPNGGGVK
jgi:hypothetical protein